MNSKITELRNLIRKEIKSALSEDIASDIAKAKQAKMLATKKLADLEKKKADADVAASKKQM